MPYIYQTTFEIGSNDIDQLEIGRSLQLSLAYMRTFLSNEPGYISARAMYGLQHERGNIHISFESTWEDWDALTEHREKSAFVEGKMLDRFELKVKPKNVAERVYEEIA